MPQFVTNGAICQCSFGMAPATLIVTRMSPMCGNMPMATINDNKPANIITFGMCQSMANPQVASATAAAQGVLTPMPCMPMISAPWAPASKVMVGGIAALMTNGKCMCNWGGNISITFAGNGAVTTEGK